VFLGVELVAGEFLAVTLRVGEADDASLPVVDRRDEVFLVAFADVNYFAVIGLVS